MKLSKNILQYANGETKLFEKFSDYFKHYRSEVLGAEGLVFAKNVSLADKEKEINKYMFEKIEKDSNFPRPEGMSLAMWANSPQVKFNTFAVIGNLIDSVIPDTLINTIGIYADIRYGGFGDSFQFDIKPRDLFAVSKSGNGKRAGFNKKQFSSTETLAPINHTLTVQVSLYKVLSGEESLADFTMKAIRSIESQLTYDTYDAMAAGLNSIPSGTNTLHLSAYSQDGAVTLAQKITAYNGGQRAMFVGTQIALSKILPANANYRYNLNSEYVTMGYIKEFQGFGTMVLPQVADYSSSDFSLKLADNRIYVISPSSDKLVKVAVEGETMSYTDDYNQNANLAQNATLCKRWDVGFITSSVAGVIDLS